MFCVYCGAKLREDSNYCHACGTKVITAPSVSNTTSHPHTSTSNPNSVYKLEPNANPTKPAPQVQNSARTSTPSYESNVEKRKKTTKALITLSIVVLIAIISYFSSCMYQHKWSPATCTEPKTCSRCGETSGVASGHQYNTPATCTEPKICSRCGETSGVAKGHQYSIPVNNNTPAICIFCGEMKPLSLPSTGQVFIGGNKDCYSSLTIKSSSGESCYIKLKDTYGRDVFSFFVRAGTTVEVNVPEGNFYVYFAYGTDWYGTDLLFGPDTTYAKDDEILDFSQYSWEYTLYPVANGNFSETPISADEF